MGAECAAVKAVIAALCCYYSPPPEGENMNDKPARSLQGMTLEAILLQLVADYGWERLGTTIDIKCFTSEPSVKSSLKFLRKTPWARKKVEDLYLAGP